LYQSSTSKILRKASILNLVFFFIFDLLLPNWDLLLLLLRAAVGPMAVLVAFEAQTFSHMVSTCLFIKTIYVHRIVVLFLRFRLGTIVPVLVGVGKGDSGVPLIDVAINLHDSGEVLIEVVRDIPHHMDGV
jgi:hypothetical protein